MFNKLRQRFEKFISNYDPAFVIVISVVAIVWSTSVIILATSLLFGYWGIIGSEVYYIVITPFLPFLLLAMITCFQVSLNVAAKVTYKYLEKFEERVKRYHKNRSAKNSESHFTKVAKNIDDETLDLIVNKSQSYSIAMWLQVAAGVMTVLLAINTYYDGDLKKATLRFALPIIIELLGILLLFIHDYFDKVITAKKQLKKLEEDKQETTEE